MGHRKCPAGTNQSNMPMCRCLRTRHPTICARRCITDHLQVGFAVNYLLAPTVINARMLQALNSRHERAPTDVLGLSLVAHMGFTTARSPTSTVVQHHRILGD